MPTINPPFATPTIGRPRTDDAKTVGTVETVAGLGVVEYGADTNVRKTVLTFTNYSLAMTRTGTTNVFGGAKVYTYPEGHWALIGAVADVNITGGTNVVATAPLVTSVGTVTAANDATLSGTEANIIGSVTSTLAANVGTMDNTSHVSPVAFAGHATATPVFINCAGNNTADACMTTGNGNIVLNGVITITWIPLGDNN